MKVDVLGISFDDITIEQSVSLAYEIIQSDKKSYIVTPNPEIVWNCRKNEELSTAVGSAAIVLPDGIGIIIAARILGTPLRGGRVPGIDFISELFVKMAESGKRVFLYGAKPGIADEAGRKLEQKYPGLCITGTEDGYSNDGKMTVDKINAAAPDLLLVCLGSPAQELWMQNNVNNLNVRLCAGLGGAIDIFAGNVKRAPVIFRKAGLEWLYRILREPRRIKRAFKLPLFLFAVIWQRIRGK